MAATTPKYDPVERDFTAREIEEVWQHGQSQDSWENISRLFVRRRPIALRACYYRHSWNHHHRGSELAPEQRTRVLVTWYQYVYELFMTAKQRD